MTVPMDQPQDQLDPPDALRRHRTRFSAQRPRQDPKDPCRPNAVAALIGVATAYGTWLVWVAGGPTTYFAGSPPDMPQSWVLLLYLAGWASVGLGFLAAALASCGRFGLAAAILPLAAVGLAGSMVGAIARMPPMIIGVVIWVPGLLGYLACAVLAVVAAASPRRTTDDA